MNNIKELREKAGLSRTELAEISEVPYRTLENWEKGTRKPLNIYQLKKVADALKCTVEELIVWEESLER